MQWHRKLYLIRLARIVSPQRREEWSIDALVRNVQRVVKEDIDVVFVEASAVSGVCGSRVRIGNYNRLCVPAVHQAASYGLSQELVLVHELAHVLCRHRALSSRNARDLSSQVETLWPGLDTSFVQKFVDDKQALSDEEEAEFLSAMILRTARQHSAVGALLIERRSHRGRRLSGLFGGTGYADKHR